MLVFCREQRLPPVLSPPTSPTDGPRLACRKMTDRIDSLQKHIQPVSPAASVTEHQLSGFIRVYLRLSAPVICHQHLFYAPWSNTGFLSDASEGKGAKDTHPDKERIKKVCSQETNRGREKLQHERCLNGEMPFWEFLKIPFWQFVFQLRASNSANDPRLLDLYFPNVPLNRRLHKLFSSVDEISSV